MPEKKKTEKIKTINSKIRIVVAMSGGVDSSVVAALLKRQGFEVIGVFLKLYDTDNFKESEKQARKIAKILKIDFYVFDLRKEFKNKIINYFLKEYKEGRTPNPCVLCNKQIKIDELFKKLKQKKIDFDFVATGHYAKIQNHKFRIFAFDYSDVILSPQAKNPVEGSRGNSAGFFTSPAGFVQNDRGSKVGLLAMTEDVKLFKAKDKEKDQSYFLWMLKQKQLKKILFPLGDYTKIQVKNMAKKFNLPVSKFHDSQEICFIQDKKIDKFLSRHIKAQPGNIVDTKNKIIGKHQGLIFYTIGQRSGIKLSGGPYYVLDKNLRENILVTTKNQKDLLKKELFVKNINYIAGKKQKLPIKISAKIRYHHKPANAVLRYQAKIKKYKLTFDKPQKAITLGQSVVFYNKQQLLGGGIIAKI